ncbi:MAG: enoyl-CoA hydratase/isomerase family protein [Thermacetogeniaceae bacterium]
MDYRAIKVEKSEGFAVVTLNRPEKLNAIDMTMISELEDIIASFESEKSLRAIVLTASGRVFSAGGDFELLKSLNTPTKAQKAIRRIGRVVERIMDMDKVWIAAVNGAAAGGGANLALACDFVVASEEARFAQSFVNIGLVPDTGGLWLLSRIVGISRAKELVMTGRMIDAREAERYGLVLKVVPSEKLLDEAMELARTLAKKPPLAIGYIKRMASRIGELSRQAYFDMEADLMGIALQTEDHREGLKAFLEKREPSFKGE